MKKQLVRWMALWIPVFMLQAGLSQAQELSAFSPSEELIREFLKRSTDTKAMLSYNEKEVTWVLSIDSSSDKLVSSRGANDVGFAPGSILRAEPGGGIDPTIGNPVMVNNLTIFVEQRSSEYKRQSQSQPGTIATMAKLSSFQDLMPFIGIGSRIRFSSVDWVELGGKKYRKGGFQITETGFVFLPGTEFLNTEGTAVVIPK